jgi:hypothetical protein
VPRKTHVPFVLLERLDQDPHLLKHVGPDQRLEALGAQLVHLPQRRALEQLGAVPIRCQDGSAPIVRLTAAQGVYVGVACRLPLSLPSTSSRRSYSL